MVLKLRALRAIIVLLCVMLFVCGCESLAKKFVRKSKKQADPMQAMVLSPEVYPDSAADKEGSYRHYLALWGGWHDELINSLSDRTGSRHREIESAQGAIDNLLAMQGFFVQDKQSVVGGYLGPMNALRSEIEKDIYGRNRQAACIKAESLKRRINGALQYDQVKDSLK
jgi:hypothetical protein